ncbi:BTAD domain-containing putative transcriptional regulator [Streptomyces sp. NPDC059169]|uniref:BTAD domain-containing putative transcriptional regulator n=1 Tax=Streptomyces sp. NPDC059169 TaxID=3346754 RepID=UPI0036C19ECB
MRYLILGVTEAFDEHGSTLPLGGARLRALLAALAYRGGRVAPVPALVRDVWGDEPPQDASAALQALVGRLRRALGRDAIQSTPGGYRLAATPDDIDLHVFENLVRTGGTQLDAGDPVAAAATFREALGLWRGPALADLAEPDAAVRPEAQRRAAVRRRIEADLRRGATGSLVPELEELIAAHPYDETLRAQLLRALDAEGRRADALTAYEDARRTLADGLGVEPGHELGTLHARLLQWAPQQPPEPKGNLRPRLNSFVGREAEISAIRKELSRSRLVTLTGPGGAGKTRLAEEAASATAGAWLVELAPLEDQAAVPGAIVSALGLRETNLITLEGQPSQADPGSQLVEYLAPRELLLVLDNCEHVISTAAEVAESLLTHCPGLRILATSREPLGVMGESVRPVDPLPEDSALRLLAERGAAVNPAFRVEDDPVAAGEICRGLDGLPLAIELAAARLRMLTLRQIADRLDDRFRLLNRGSRTVQPRQQTLRAVVDWSWDLLDDGERTVLRQVSVFAGGWDLTAAEALSGPDVAGHLGALVDKSLVTAAPTVDGEMRFRLLETIHEYAAERAAEEPELRAAAESAHTAHFQSVAEQAEPLLRTDGQLRWIRHLETDLDNIRAALHRTTTRPEQEPLAVRLVLAMGWFWCLREYRPEGLAWAARTIGLSPDPEDGAADPRYWPRMQLRMLHLFLAIENGPDFEVYRDPRTRDLLRRLRDAFSAGGPEAARFPGLAWPFTTYLTDGPEGILELLDRAVANCRVHGGDWEVGVTLMYRTHIAIDHPGSIGLVDDDLAELREISRRVGDRWMRAQVAGAVAETSMMRGRYEEAHAAYAESLELAREVGAHSEAPFLLARMAELGYRAGDADAALRGLEEATAEVERHNVPTGKGYISYLRAVIALERGEFARAEELTREARAACPAGTSPPHFMVALDGVDARIAVYGAGGGPGAGIRGLATALRDAHEVRCSEVVTAHLAESTADVLLLLGEERLAVRLLAAAETWRNGMPRSVPERRVTDAVETGARAVLGERRYAAEYAAGAALSVPQVLDALAPVVALAPQIPPVARASSGSSGSPGSPSPWGRAGGAERVERV